MFDFIKKIFKKNSITRELYDYSKKNDILLIPLVKNYNLDNLYPQEDEVENWNTFIVGNDKTYILAKNQDFVIENNILNTNGKDNMDMRIYNFLDRIWDITLKKKQIQIFVYINSKLYLLNSYYLTNDNNKIIGAICFIRSAGKINQNVFELNDEQRKNIT